MLVFGGVSDNPLLDVLDFPGLYLSHPNRLCFLQGWLDEKAVVLEALKFSVTPVVGSWWSL